MSLNYLYSDWCSGHSPGQVRSQIVTAGAWRLLTPSRCSLAMSYRRQRIRDPLHGLIEFRAEHFEHVLWQAIQTRPFQRLRRVKQLGFSEFVYPGATHTRFAHSLGTFHVARQLMEIIKRHKFTGIDEPKIQQVLAATLLHDLGHGPFSHAFEDVGKRLKLKSVDHEKWTERLIRETEIAEALKAMGSGFANDVADIFKRGHPESMYEAAVSSQFDADRLDYMQRDRLMTGTNHGAIDFAWLLANIEIGEVPHGVDDDPYGGSLETFVLGAKAVSAAETYVLGLLQLYQTVYFHKATRGIEKLFTELLVRVFESIRDNRVCQTGLPESHPLVKFALAPENLDVYLSLDDAVVWGAIPMLAEAKDTVIAELAGRLRDRKLYKCLDVWQLTAQLVADTDRVRRCCPEILERLKTRVIPGLAESHHLLLDQAARAPYKRFDESKGPLNQIRIRTADGGNLVDINSRSAIVPAIPSVELWRVYLPADQHDLRKRVQDTVREVVNEKRN